MGSAPALASCAHSRSHDLCLLPALDPFPALELRRRPTLLDQDDVADLELVLLVVRVILLRAPHGLLHDRMGISALDAHHDGLVLLVAHYDAFERALRHLSLLRLGFRARGALGLGCGLRSEEHTSELQSRFGI